MRTADVSGLFDYGYWVTDRLLDAASRLEAEQFTAPAEFTTRSLRETLVHALDVEQSWRQRLRGEPPEVHEAVLSQDDFPTIAALGEAWDRDEADMRAWLDSLDDPALDAEVDLGEHRYSLWTMLMHIQMHSAQSRSEAAAILTHAGQSPGDLDFLDYVDSVDGR
jgi:uncharacterized damage-inducible protein DinB